MTRSRWLHAALAAALASQPLAAQPTVTYRVSGDAGDWTLNFALANTIPTQYEQTLYFFGVDLGSGATLIGSPRRWNNGDEPAPYSPAAQGGSSRVYSTVWSIDPIDHYHDGLAVLPGQSLSGFVARYTGVAAPTSVPWLLFSADVFGTNTAPVPGTFSTGRSAAENPGFEGVALGPSTVPEPGTWVLLGTGLVAVGFATRRRRDAQV